MIYNEGVNDVNEKLSYMTVCVRTISGEDSSVVPTSFAAVFPQGGAGDHTGVSFFWCPFSQVRNQLQAS